MRGLDLGHQRRHLGLGLEGVGQQQRHEHDLGDAALGQLVDHLQSGRRAVVEEGDVDVELGPDLRAGRRGSRG